MYYACVIQPTGCQSLINLCYVSNRVIFPKCNVVIQKKPEVFNKASLMNVGFLEARASADFDCFIFHDVDMLPEDDRNFYVCSLQPRHVGSHVNLSLIHI